jgi:hypothetical protein
MDFELLNMRRVMRLEVEMRFQVVCELQGWVWGDEGRATAWGVAETQCAEQMARVGCHPIELVGSFNIPFVAQSRQMTNTDLA